MQSTHWELYAETRQQALAFLDAHGLIPETLYIDADGWVEAVYGDTSYIDHWQHVRKSASVDVHLPALQNKRQQYAGPLHIRFNLSQKKPSLWQRLRHFFLQARA